MFHHLRDINLVNALGAQKQEEKQAPLLRLISLQLYISSETAQSLQVQQSSFYFSVIMVIIGTR